MGDYMQDGDAAFLRPRFSSGYITRFKQRGRRRVRELIGWGHVADYDVFAIGPGCLPLSGIAA